MNLYELLDTFKGSFTAENEPSAPKLEWFSSEDDESARDAARTNAGKYLYIQVIDMDEKPTDETHEGLVVYEMNTIVEIYQNPDKSSGKPVTPSRREMTAAFDYFCSLPSLNLIDGIHDSFIAKLVSLTKSRSSNRRPRRTATMGLMATVYLRFTFVRP